MSWHIALAVGAAGGCFFRGCLARFYFFWDKDDPRPRKWRQGS